MFVSLAFSSCTCKPASPTSTCSARSDTVFPDYGYYHGNDPAYPDGTGGTTGGYDCTCDETDDCAASHVCGGKSISLCWKSHNYCSMVHLVSKLSVVKTFIEKHPLTIKFNQSSVHLFNVNDTV